MPSIPEFATHYHRAGRAPFLNLSDLADAELVRVLAELSAPTEQAGSARRFGPAYMGLRTATEARARELFLARGGRPLRAAPHYFVLGDSPWFAGLYADPVGIRIPLGDLPAEATSITWGDSISALGLGADLGLPGPGPGLGDGLRRLDELAELVADHGLPAGAAPADGYAGHERTLIDVYLEIQLWSDEPIRRLLDRH